jgi:hypothetical protein
MQLALEVHDAASSARWSAVLKHLEAEAARGAPTSDALDLTRLTDAEADALEYLCEVARGNRPAPGDAKWARWVAAISR